MDELGERGRVYVYINSSIKVKSKLIFFTLFFFQEMKVNWATSPGNAPKTDTSSK